MTTSEFERLLRWLRRRSTVRVQMWAIDAPKGWRSAYGRIWVGPDTHSEAVHWSYEMHAFIDSTVSGSVAAALLRGNGATLGDLTIQPEQATWSALPTRYPSQHAWGHIRTARPRTEWTIGSGARQDVSTGSGLLVGQGPTFISSAAAVESFFGLDRNQGWQAPTAAWHVIRTHSQAYLQELRVSATSAICIVSGNLGRSTLLEVNTRGETVYLRRLTKRQTTTVPLPHGLTPGTLVVLRSSKDWLDYRYFDSAVGNGTTADPSVTFARPESELDLLTSLGEGPQIEYKTILSQDEQSRKRFLKTVAAFASDVGGTVLIGVGDDGSILGLGDIVRDELTQTITNLIRNRIAPEPIYDVRFVDTRHGPIAIVEISGSGHWHAVNPAAPEFYVRRGASTMRARVEEITSSRKADAQHWGALR